MPYVSRSYSQGYARMAVKIAREPERFVSPKAHDAEINNALESSNELGNIIANASIALGVVSGGALIFAAHLLTRVTDLKTRLNEANGKLEAEIDSRYEINKGANKSSLPIDDSPVMSIPARFHGPADGLKRLATRTIRMCWMASLLGLVAAYLLAYAMFVDMHEPSIGEDGEPYFRSSFRKLTYLSRGTWNISVYFPHAGPANWIFLPVDQIWRSLKHMPRSAIDPSDDYWAEYSEYKIAIGEWERPEANAEQPGAAQPATKPADKVSPKDQPQTPTSKVNPR